MRPHGAIACALVAASFAACAGSRQELRELPTTDPMANVSAEQLYDAGMALARAGDLVRAEQYLVAAQQRGMDEERVVRQLMSVCVQASRYRAAVAYAQPYLERRPHDWRLRYLVATIQSGLDEHAAARRELEAVLADNGRHAEAHFTLAALLRGHFNDAAAADPHFRRYLELEPSGPHAEEARAGLLRQVPQ